MTTGSNRPLELVNKEIRECGCDTALFSQNRESSLDCVVAVDGEDFEYRQLGVDKLKLAQTFDSDAIPSFGIGAFKVGQFSVEVRRSSGQRLLIRDQFGNCIDVRVSKWNNRLTVEYNPSLIMQQTNILLVSSVSGAISLLNSVFALIGLPTLAIGPAGCKILRIDIAQNNWFGSQRHAEQWIRAQSSVAIRGKPGHLFPNGNTVAWGMEDGPSGKVVRNSKRIICRYYFKGSNSVKGKKATKLHKAAGKVGLVRHELQLMGEFLKKDDLYDPANWSDQVMQGLLAKYPGTEASVTFRGAEGLEEELWKRYSKRRARKYIGILYQWLHGCDLMKNLGKNLRYEAEKVFRALGVEIRMAFDCSRLPAGWNGEPIFYQSEPSQAMAESLKEHWVEPFNLQCDGAVPFSSIRVAPTSFPAHIEHSINGVSNWNLGLSGLWAEQPNPLVMGTYGLVGVVSGGDQAVPMLVLVDAKGTLHIVDPAAASCSQLNATASAAIEKVLRKVQSGLGVKIYQSRWRICLNRLVWKMKKLWMRLVFLISSRCSDFWRIVSKKHGE